MSGLEPNLATIRATARPKKGALGGQYMGAQELLYNYGPYDSYRITSGSTLQSEYRFFVEPVNQIGSGFTRRKTYAETNMTAGGRLPSKINATVSTIYVTIDAEGDAAGTSAVSSYIEAMYYDSLMEFRVDDARKLGERHAVEFGGLGISGYVDQTSVSDVAIVSPESTLAISKYMLSAPITIPSNTRFGVSLVPNTNNTYLQTVPDGGDLKITVYLYGAITNVAVN